MGGGSVRHACFQNDDRGWCAEVVVFSLVVERRFFQMMIVVGVLLLFSGLWEGGEIQREREGGRNMLRRKRSEFGEKTKEVEEEEQEGFLECDSFNLGKSRQNK